MSDCLIEKFNCGCKEMLMVLKMESSIQLQPRYYYLDFELRKPKILELNKNAESHRYLNYYWMEFEYMCKRYKISMFYKDMDHMTGNIHVMPGAIQIWEGGDCTGYIDEKSLGLYRRCCTPFEEYGWKPVLFKPLFWNIHDMPEVAKYVWSRFLKQKAASDQIYKGCLKSREFCSEIESLWCKLQNDKLIELENGEMQHTYRTKNYKGVGVFVKHREWYFHEHTPDRFCNITKRWCIKLDGAVK